MNTRCASGSKDRPLLRWPFWATFWPPRGDRRHRSLTWGVGLSMKPPFSAVGGDSASYGPPTSATILAGPSWLIVDLLLCVFVFVFVTCGVKNLLSSDVSPGYSPKLDCNTAQHTQHTCTVQHRVVWYALPEFCTVVLYCALWCNTTYP